MLHETKLKACKSLIVSNMKLLGDVGRTIDQ